MYPRSLLLMAIACLQLEVFSQSKDEKKTEYTSKDSSHHQSRRIEIDGFGMGFGLQQNRYSMLEFGCGYVLAGSTFDVFPMYTHSATLNAYWNPGRNIYGVGISLERSLGPLVLGVKSNLLFKENQKKLGIMPMLGINFGYFSISYGYQFKLQYDDIPYTNRHVFMIEFHRPFKLIE